MTIDYRAPEFLLSHIEDTLAFYHPNVDDPKGGFFQNFSDNGEVYDPHTRHLVSSTRFVFNYARAYQEFGSEQDLQRVRSGVQFLREQHYNPVTDGYSWLLQVNDDVVTVQDNTNHCYGLAFVILAYSWAYRVGVSEAQDYLNQAWDTMERYFWDPSAGLYKDEYNGDFSQCSGYRGQNANMHSCEALLAAYESTREHRYLERALLLADNMVNRQAEQAKGLIWEHYDTQWQVDWEYNKSDPKNLFRPWGFQPGHHTEWAKLLLLLAKHSDADWLVPRAKQLFDIAVETSWDHEYGGLCYGFGPDMQVCDDEKYFWVQAESFACAALLAQATGEEQYWQWYDKIWAYSWQHLVDHQYGAWFRILSRDNQKLETCKSPVGKTDYHTMGACYDVLKVVRP